MKRTLLRTGLALALVLGLLLPTALTAVAQDTTSTPATPGQTLADDGSLEVGVWYVVDYQNCGGWGLGDLPATAPDALGLRNRLIDPYYWWIFPYPTPTWSAPLVWGNGLAWEEDWKRAALGGTEESQVDRVDLAYFAGHGAASGFFFGVGGNTHDDCQVTANDAFASWGTNDNDWIMLAACNVLDDPYANLQSWARAMNGTRLLMGMKTVMSDVDLGVNVGWHVRWGKSMTYSWFKSVNERLPSSQVARILAEETAHYSDTWANHASATPVDDDFYWWTHQSGVPILRSPEVAAFSANRLAAIGNEMPVFAVQPLSLAEATAEFNNVTAAFGLTDTAPITASAAIRMGNGALATNDFFLSSNADLEMDSSAGNFVYANSAELWNAEVALRQQRAPDRVDVTPAEAQAIADAFLAQNGLMPGNVQSTMVYQDELEMVQDEGRAAGTPATRGPERVFATATNYQVQYTRALSYTVPAADGRAGTETVAFQVYGPGATLMVNVNTTAPAGRTGQALLQEAVMGGIGGNRQVLEPTRANGSVLTAQVLPTTTVTILFDKLAPQVALGHVPLVADSREIVAYNLGYWEGPMGMNQDQLIPVYALDVRATQEGGQPQFYTEYIPVNESYMAPYAEIVTPAGGTEVLPGQQVTLEAADAAKTLAELGVDPALTFALGTGDPDSYTYEWYLGEVAAANRIGAGRTLRLLAPDANGADGKAAEIKLVLVVKDTLKAGEPNVSTDELTLTVPDAATVSFLPLASKQ